MKRKPACYTCGTTRPPLVRVTWGPVDLLPGPLCMAHAHELMHKLGVAHFEDNPTEATEGYHRWCVENGETPRPGPWSAA